METYWISGVQLGMIKGFISSLRKDEVEKIIDDIIEKQQVSDDARELTLLTGDSK